jgi:predicted RNase H-like nuclease
MRIPRAEKGSYYFECYPHPAIIGLFDLNSLLKYKVRHQDGGAWEEILELVRSLASRDLQITNIADLVPLILPHTKDNENKVDAIICAYVAAFWWKYGTERSTMIGDIHSGYIVTPHNEHTLPLLKETFRERMNMGGTASSPQISASDASSVSQLSVM